MRQDRSRSTGSPRTSDCCFENTGAPEQPVPSGRSLSGAVPGWSGRGRVLLEYLPLYAPELNPSEYGWACIKGNPLANCCPDHLDDLHGAVREAADTVASQQDLLRSFVHATELPIRI